MRGDSFQHAFVSLFVCVEVLWSSQPMSSAVSFPNHTFTGQV